jgi:hypothetical protein
VTSTAKTLATVAFLGALGFATRLCAQPLERPDWSAHFGVDGSVVRVAGVVDAVFLEDKLSDGVGIDMSVTVDGARSLLDNGTVPGPHDLGNGYLLARTDGAGNLIYHIGVERLTSVADTWVEFELNRGIVRVRSGAPWPIEGERQLGDLVVRVTYRSGALSRAELFVWDGYGLRALAAAASSGSGCTDVGSALMFCDGPPPLTSMQPEVWDVWWRPLTPAPPDAFVEVGLNVTALLGSNVQFTSVQLRTPKDIVLDAFRVTGSRRRHLTGEGAHE